MSIQEFFAEINTDSIEVWNVILCAGGGHGPSYKEQFSPSDEGISKSHTHVAILKKNIGITIAWGLEQYAGFAESWTESYQDSRATSCFVDFFFCGNLVWRELAVYADGGRILVPLPRLEPSTKELSYSIAAERVQFYRLLNNLEKSGHNLDHYLDLGKIKITSDKWPQI